MLLPDYLLKIKADYSTPSEFFGLVVLAFCATAIIFSIIANFLLVQDAGNSKKEKKSLVETGTMSLFFLFFFFLIKYRLTVLEIDFLHKPVYLLIGLFLVVLGTIFNIWGRIDLGNNWANQIKIYKNQTLVTRGPFKIVRHPLYASLIWIFFGASIYFSNISAFLANLLIFIPFMYYRAKQEERVLEKEFKEYTKYSKKTGMFFPKFAILNPWSR